MSILGIRWTAEPVRAAGFAEIAGGGGDYVNVGGPLDNPAVQLYFLNTTDATLAISLNGVTDAWYMPPGTNFFIDAQSNRSNPAAGLMIAANTQAWTAPLGDDPTEGALYLSVFYAAPADSI